MRFAYLSYLSTLLLSVCLCASNVSAESPVTDDRSISRTQSTSDVNVVATADLVKRINDLLRPLSISDIKSKRISSSSDGILSTDSFAGTTTTHLSQLRPDGSSITIKESIFEGKEQSNEFRAFLKAGSVFEMDLRRGAVGREILFVGEPTADPRTQPLGYQVVVFTAGQSRQEYRFRDGMWHQK